MQPALGIHSIPSTTPPVESNPLQRPHAIRSESRDLEGSELVTSMTLATAVDVATTNPTHPLSPEVPRQAIGAAVSVPKSSSVDPNNQPEGTQVPAPNLVSEATSDSNSCTTATQSPTSHSFQVCLAHPGITDSDISLMWPARRSAVSTLCCGALLRRTH